ncbi:MAG: hypothetical protein KAR05_01895 [Candidatus Omnitrophica bacterium]|nr:hypothetical protein [Candidatus Omnitrophota bacterium]
MTPELVKTVCRAIAVVCIAIGGFGSVLCVPYALTPFLNVITAAGIYFIAGAVMITGGLIAFILLARAEK